MNYTTIHLSEESIQETENHGEYQLEHINLPVFNENLTLKGSFCKPKSTGYFVDISKSTATTDTKLKSEDDLEPLSSQAVNSDIRGDEYKELTGADMRQDNQPPLKRTIYALLVGICDYRDDIALAGERVIFPKLSGCIADAEKIKNYLEQDSSFNIDIILLTDAKATKAEVVKHFKEHLGKAQVDDIAFFYYSGHGAQEYADKKYFSSETDGKIESVVCYYDENTADQALLSDKELRWLIKAAAANGAHIVTIFDCCHSAGITRNANLIKNTFSNVVEKRIPFVFPQRNWEQYIFADTISPDLFITNGENKVLSEGDHIQMSACESYESALEVGGEGVFTKALLKVLQHNQGNISYSSLHSQVRQYLQGVFEQKPRIYFTGTDNYLASTQFLNKTFKPGGKALAEVVYNDELGWLLNRGAIHGIKAGNKTLKLYLADDTSKKFDATIARVETDYTVLNISGVDKSKVYLARVKDMLTTKLNLHIKDSVANLDDQQKLLDNILEDLHDTVLLTSDEQDADYVLRYLNGSYYITLPNDPYRPIADTVKAISMPALTSIIQQLEHISKWKFVKLLANNDDETSLDKNALKIEVAIGNSDYEPYRDDENITIDLLKQGEQWKNNLKIRLTNQIQQPVFCCTLLVTRDFASFSGFLNPSVYTLEIGNSVELKLQGEVGISLSLDETMKWYNLESSKELFKIIASTEMFNAEALTMEALPAPPAPDKFRSAINYNKKQTVANRGWLSRNINFEIKNPLYNIVSQKDLDTMLGDEKTADFALGLYFEPQTTDAFTIDYRLKSEIALITQDGKKGFLSDGVLDIANSWARNKRNKIYINSIAKYPERMRIVSEGDSWFQHPLVYDIIDHLSRTYSVYCVAAAGDTLRNMVSGKRKEGEYYLDTIKDKEPKVFLISGGGNDILGSQFRSYLADNPDTMQNEGLMPERFLKTTLMDELKSLMTIYATVFQTLQTSFPFLKVIVHGYDYPIKLNEAKKGWLGRYMIEKGIKRPGDRKAIIRYIMDTFNTMLNAEADKTSNVIYLDVRGLVRYDTALGVDQWYDEIHPNDDGFQQIAMKYIQKINELTLKSPSTIVIEK